MLHLQWSIRIFLHLYHLCYVFAQGSITNWGPETEQWYRFICTSNAATICTYLPVSQIYTESVFNLWCTAFQILESCCGWHTVQYKCPLQHNVSPFGEKGSKFNEAVLSHSSIKGRFPEHKEIRVPSWKVIQTTVLSPYLCWNIRQSPSCVLCLIQSRSMHMKTAFCWATFEYSSANTFKMHVSLKELTKVP